MIARPDSCQTCFQYEAYCRDGGDPGGPSRCWPRHHRLLALGLGEAWSDGPTFDEPVYIAAGLAGALHHDLARLRRSEARVMVSEERVEPFAYAGVLCADFLVGSRP